jgi:hypothetical protein
MCGLSGSRERRERMKIFIKLTDRQQYRLKQIQKKYKDRGLDYTLSETFDIVTRPHIKDYLDGQLDVVEQTLFTDIKGSTRRCL